jgi:striatin 1/3/4
MFRNHYYNFIEIPTSCTWDELNDNIIYVSHVASYIKVYDIETGQSKGDMVYYVEKNIPYESQQANKILYHKDNLIVTGHEDRQIRFFDIRTNSIVKNYVAHVDAISSLCNGIGEYELLTGSHDGTVRCWDLRGGNNKLIFDIPAHRKKYDEGCLSINVIKNESLMITSGADGIIKIFKI